MQELNETALQLFDVAVVSRHMVGIDICNDCEHWLQVHEGRVTFVRFSYQVIALPQPRIRIGRFQASADDKGRIESALCKNAGYKAGSGCFAVGARHRHREAEAHQFGEHLGAADNGHQLFPGGCHFRIGFIDRAGDNDSVSITNIVGRVAEEHCRALFFEAPCLFVGLQVRSLDSVAKAQHYFGNSRHARAADADEVHAMNTAHTLYHAVDPACLRHSSVIRRSAFGLASERAVVARCISSARD